MRNFLLVGIVFLLSCSNQERILIGTWTSKQTIENVETIETCQFFVNNIEVCNLNISAEFDGRKVLASRTATQNWKLENGVLNETNIDGKLTNLEINGESILPSSEVFKRNSETLLGKTNLQGYTTSRKVEFSNKTFTLYVNNGTNSIWNKIE